MSNESAPLLQDELVDQTCRLYDQEIQWRDLQPWLLASGYRLRQRYAPDWRPSWEGIPGSFFQDYEDGVPISVGNMIDATRVSDGQFVILKMISSSGYPNEAPLGRYFTTEPRASDPRNHCVPVYDVLQHPTKSDQVILVMPLLREFEDPGFQTVGEVVEFLRQIFQGLHFMHENHVAHRDIGYYNLMMDANPIFPVPFHPFKPNKRRDFSGTAKSYSRTEYPVTYYIIDFGYSMWIDPNAGPPKARPSWGADRTVPEYLQSMETEWNPFAVDVYCLGNLLRRSFFEGHGIIRPMLGFQFLEPLVNEMVQEDPNKRPTMTEALIRFNELQAGLSSWKLRSRIVKKGDSSFLGIFRWVAHWWRRIGFIMRGIPPLPTPAERKPIIGQV